MQILESLVSGNNPAFKAASRAKNGGKHGPFIFDAMCQQREKNLLPSVASLKRVNRFDHRGCKPFMRSFIA